MGWFLRKALKVGPVRLNLSKSGLGASVGVKGARLSFGPRGTHVFAGRGGVYFRERVGGARPRGRPTEVLDVEADRVESRQEIETADAACLVDPDGANLLRELNKRYGLVSIAKITSITGVLLTCMAVWAAIQVSSAVWILVGVLAIATVAGTIAGRRRDIDRRTVNLDFELDGDSKDRFDEFERALSRLAGCSRLWRLTSEQTTEDWKRHGGANKLVARNVVTMRRQLPAYVKSNITPYALVTRVQTLYFLPDRLLVYQGGRIGSVPYDELEVGTDHTRFHEEEGVPGDAQVVDTTWRYVNKKGGPDRRFKDNCEIPVCKYGELSLTSPTGMRFELQTSNPDVLDTFAEAVERVRCLKPGEGPEEAPQESPARKATLSHVELECTGCGKRFRALVEHAGKSTPCGNCGATITIPGA